MAEEVRLPTEGSAAAMLLADDRRIPIGPDGVSIGRDAENDVVLDSELVSRRHARVSPRRGGFELLDTGSRNGTYLNGEKIDGSPRRLESGDVITIGAEELRFVAGEPTRIEPQPTTPAATRRVAVEGGRLGIGRDPGNEVALDDPNVSRFHAEVVPRGGELFELRDLGSRNGTRLNGTSVTEGAASFSEKATTTSEPPSARRNARAAVPAVCPFRTR